VPQGSTVSVSPQDPGHESVRRGTSNPVPALTETIIEVTDMAETSLSDVFVELADTLVDDFDVMDFMHVLTERCVQVLGVSAAGILLADPAGALQVVAASSEPCRLLETFQVQTDEGPSLECFASGQPVTVADLSRSERWPLFASAAIELGFSSVLAVPMRLRAETIGALSFFMVEYGGLHESAQRLGRALADVATIGLLQQRAIHHRELLAEQLQTALSSRIVIEQAKGILAERLHVDVDQAFILLRRGARSHHRRLSDLAYAIVAGTGPVPPAIVKPRAAPATGPIPVDSATIRRSPDG
jgi:GAF domain-containing protein